MRLYPPGVLMSRYCQETAVISEDITVEKGTLLAWFIPGMTHII